jgi:hypothetical protein
MYNNGNSSKNVTGSSVVDGTLENADYADNAISGDKIDGGTISGSVTLVTPDIGTPSAGTLTNCDGTASSLTAGNVTTNANLTGVVTSSGNATAIADNAISGDKIDAGVISNFQSTGIDDRQATGKSIYTNGTSVGVGTDSPSKLFEVNKTTAGVGGELFIRNDAGTGAAGDSTILWMGRQSDRSVQFKTTSTQWYGKDPKLEIIMDDAVTAMTIDTTGRIGINTAPSTIMQHIILTSHSHGNYLQSDHTAGHAFTSHMTNTSFTGKVLNLQAEASAGSGWNFGTMYSSSASDLEFNLRGDGNGYCDGSWSGGGADYAEYFEWSDGNASNEDRRGFSVVLDGDKIRPAVDGESPIGVISVRPAVVGDNDMDKWKQKYLRSDFGDYILEPYTVTEWEAQEVDEEADTIPATYKTVSKSFESDKIPIDETVPSEAIVLTEDADGTPFKRRTLNPDWSADTEYVSREDRQEWDTVGLMGKLRIVKGQPVDSRWIKMRDVSDIVEEWLVR